MHHARWRDVLSLLLAKAVLLASAASAQTVVVFPRPESAGDQRATYPTRLLEMALARAPRVYRLALSPLRMQQGRALARLRDGDGIDVVASMTSIEREAALLPIRIPIDKGLMGWRLLLIDKTQARRFGAIDSVAQLKQMRAGQGHDWPDTAILRGNGFRVHTTTSYDSLFSMLENQRIDYFPRSTREIWSELALHRDRLMIEPSLALHYRTAHYFFVRKSDPQLAADLQAGLEKMIADGSFEQVFQAYFGQIIKDARLSERRIFTLENPLAPSTLPLERKNLWFRE